MTSTAKENMDGRGDCTGVGRERLANMINISRWYIAQKKHTSKSTCDAMLPDTPRYAETLLYALP